MDPQSHQVIIIGAGASGIGAALTLSRNKIPFIVLQARDRVGGRLLSANINDVQSDLGACWVHSFSNKNPVAKEVDRLKWPKGKLSSGPFSGRVMLDGEIGKEFDEETTQMAYFYFKRFFQIAQKNGQKSAQDLSLYEAARQYYEGEIQKIQPAERRLTKLLINMTEHYEASSMKELSAKNYDQTTDQGGDYFPDKSYASLMKKIAQEIKHTIRFNTVVEEINYQKDIVEIRCEGGIIYQAKKVIAGIPLGLLKAKDIKFIPQLPEGHQRAISKLGIGLMNKIIISFTENFWGYSAWLSIGCDERGKYPHFYNFSRDNKPMLCCFVTDDFARKIQAQTDEQIINDLVNLLKKIYSNKKVEVKDYKITRWGQQKFSKGSYAAFHVDSSEIDCHRLRGSINDRLWLVGEHCYAEHIGTAHGAFQTGVWAGENLLKSLKWVNPEWKL